jgi:hypothetical protein
MNNLLISSFLIISVILILVLCFMVFKYKRIYIYIFCLWIWIATFLYYFDYISFSPLYLSFGAIIFTLYLQLIHHRKGRTIIFKFSIIIFELFICLVNFYKHFYISKTPLFSLPDIIKSIILFAIYQVFLHMNNLSFYDYYFNKLD